MNKTAFIYNTVSVDWFGVIVAFACLVGLIAACILRKLQKGSINDMLTVFCISLPLAVLLGRIQYCISEIETEIDGFGYIFTGMSDGGYGLYGAILGVALGVLITSLIYHCSFGELADCTAAVGAIIITVGRFATQFTTAETGFPMEPNALTHLNESDGLNYLSVYLIDGAVEAVISVFCLYLFLRSYIPKERRYSKGSVTLVFLMMHGLNQVVMDSLRTDALALFDNEFVKSSQIIGIVSWLVIITILIVRAVKNKTFKSVHISMIAAFVVLIIYAVTREYRVGSSNYVSAHIQMGISMLIMAVLSVIIFYMSESDKALKAKKQMIAEAENHEATQINGAEGAAEGTVAEKREETGAAPVRKRPKKVYPMLYMNQYNILSVDNSEVDNLLKKKNS